MGLANLSNPLGGSGGSGSGGGSGTVASGSTNTLAKYTATTTVGNSLVSDDGTTLTYSGTGGIAATGTATGILTVTGATSGHFKITGVDAMAQDVTLSLAAQTSGAATLTVPDLAGVNATIATQAFAKGKILGTFASPDTTAGSITWPNNAVILITTSAAGATRTYTLPAASSYGGQGFMLMVGAGANHVNLQPQSGAQLVLAGTLLTADHYIQCATSAAGNYIAGWSDGTNWQTAGSSGTWADSASP